METRSAATFIGAALCFAAVIGPSLRSHAQSVIFPGAVQVAVATGTTSLGPNLTLAAPLNQAQLVYVCGFNLSYAGVGTISPASLGGLAAGTMYFQNSSLGNPEAFQQTFSPCLPALANTSITLGVTTDATATKVSGSIWGLWQ